jgi:hypothetical protein
MEVLEVSKDAQETVLKHQDQIKCEIWRKVLSKPNPIAGGNFKVSGANKLII